MKSSISLRFKPDRFVFKELLFLGSEECEEKNSVPQSHMVPILLSLGVENNERNGIMSPKTCQNCFSQMLCRFDKN